MAKGLSKKGLAWVIFALLIGLGLVTGGLLVRRWLMNLPTVQEQAQIANQTDVFISSPGNHSSWPLDASIPIQVQIRSAHQVSQVDLYAEDELVASQDMQTQPSPVFFQWQPIERGKHILTAQVTTAAGQVFISNPVTVTISAPAGSLSLIEAEPGETLPDLSQRYGLGIEALEAANPDLDPSAPIPAGTGIFIPDEPNFTPPTLSSEDTEEKPFPDLIAVETQENLFSKLKPILQSWAVSEIKPPTAPTLTAQVSGCDVQLTIQDLSDNEEGFFVYRLAAGKAEAEKITLLAANQSAASLGYLDEGQSGEVLYRVSAFNSGGESSSPPAAAALPSNCADTAPIFESGPGFDYEISIIDGSISLDKHVIQFQLPVDLAYLYISVNGQDWERIPEGNQKFLSGDGDKFDLDIYLDQIINKNPATVLEIEMEIWGWSGGKLIDHGTLHVSVRRTVLRVCGIANAECGDDLLRTEINLPPHIDPETLSYHFFWDTADMPGNIDYVWQVAAKPYTGDAIRSTQSLIISRGVYNVNDTHFKFGLSYLYKEGQFDLGDWPYMGQNFDSNFFDDVYPKDTPFTLYVRVLPFDEENNQLPASNTVVLHYTTEWEDPLNPTYASNLPSRYQIEFLPETYRAPVLVQDHLWGCIVFDQNVYPSHPLLMGASGITYKDFDIDPANCGSPAASSCNGKQKPILYAAGSTKCPNNYSEPSGFWNDVKTILSGTWDNITGGLDYLSEGLENAKQYLAEQVASVIPGCGEECTDWVKAGLEAGFTAITGIPPTIPSYEDLMDEGIDYAVELAAQEIGPMCEALCKEAIRYGLQETVAQIKISHPAPACVDDGTAHARGKEPFCPNLMGVDWHPAPGAVYEPALISLRISRPEKPDNQFPLPEIPLEKHKQYRLAVYSYGFNDTRLGDWFPICGFQEGLDGSNEIAYDDLGFGYHQKRQIDNPLEAALYFPQGSNFPRLGPGESQTIPLIFDPQLFWRMNHLYDVQQAGVNYEAFIKHCGDDWPYLYYDGLTRLTAVEECLNDQNEWVPCSGGGMDVFETLNPSAP